MRSPRTVALVGGGHAHVQVLRRWAMERPADARLVLVVDQPVAVYSGMVPGFVAGDYRRAELEIDVVPLARRAGAAVVLAAALDLDPARGELALQGRPPLRFDVASLDVGAGVRGLDVPGVAEHALATRPIGRFVAELDARLAALSARGRSGERAKIVVVGAGAAGCELAFTLGARLRRTGLEADITLVTSDSSLLAAAAPAARRRIAEEAARRGVAIAAERRVVRVEADAVDLAAIRDPASAAQRLAADLVVWATGASPGPFPCERGTAVFQRDRDGFLAVDSTLRAVGYENVFAAGDCARPVDHPWVPRAGVYAVRAGPVLDRNLRAWLAGRPLAHFRPQRDFLALLNLGEGRALGTKWGAALAGRGVFRLKDRIDRAFVERFRVLDPEADQAVQRGARAPSAGSRRPGPSMGELAPMPCGGCAAKLAAAPLEAALARLPEAPHDASVVAGVAARDDVAITRAADGAFVLHNIDAIRAFCDDPWLVGRVAAVNATSDLFAKGGRPRHAQALIGLPETADARTAEEMLHQVLLGVRETLDALGVSLLGGHTMTSDALSVGLSVTGDAPADHPLVSQAGARPGDALVLTKPLGTGVLLAADMRGLARGEWVAQAHGSMLRTNAVASRLMLEAGARAATDVTGFGLAGHLSNLLRSDGLAARLDRAAIPCLPGARALFASGLRSTAEPANRAAFAEAIAGADEHDLAWLLDPQTSGGLLFALPAAAVEPLARAFEAAGEPAFARIGFIADRAGSDAAPIRLEGTAPRS